MNIEQSIQSVVEKAFEKQFKVFSKKLLEDLKPKKVYTVAEAAKHHRVSSRTMLNWIHQGKIKASSPSIGNYRISHKDLNNIK